VTATVISPPYPDPVLGHGPVYFNLEVPGTAQVDWSIFTVAFRKIREETFPVSGAGIFQWDLKDKSGVWAANGPYYLRVQVKESRGTVTRILKILVLR
jgi:hypothetical protein